MLEWARVQFIWEIEVPSHILKDENANKTNWNNKWLKNISNYYQYVSVTGSQNTYPQRIPLTKYFYVINLNNWLDIVRRRWFEYDGFDNSFDGSMQDCSNSIANALELLLSYIKPSIWLWAGT